MKILLVAVVLLVASPAYSQIICTRYGNMTSCDGDNLSNRTITEYNRNSGVIIDEKGNVTPYSVLPSRRAEEDRRDEDRRRALIYGDDRRERDSSRSRRSSDRDEYGR